MRNHYGFGRYKRWEIGYDLHIWAVGLIVHPDTFILCVGPLYISREDLPF